MIIHDYKCQVCEEVTEHYCKSDSIPDQIVCPICNGVCDKVFLPSYTTPVDAPWLQEVLTVVDKTSDKPWCKEFLKHPSRQNYNAWKKGEGLRHRDPAEPNFKPIDREGRRKKIKKMLLESHMQRNAISINTRETA